MPKKNENKTILHLCSGIVSDSQPYKDSGYNVVRIGKEIGVENYHPPPQRLWNYSKSTLHGIFFC